LWEVLFGSFFFVMAGPPVPASLPAWGWD
jgi:hypothetical protein